MSIDNRIARVPPVRPAAQIQDEAILDLFFRRMDDAIALTRTKYGALCRSVALRILADSRDAEECENDTYLRAWNAIPPDRPRALGAYLARITRNLALDRRDYNNAAARSSALTQAFEEFEPWLPARLGDPEAASENLAFRRVLNDFLRRQSAEARAIFLRRYWYGESVREIAEALGVGESKVKTSLFRTRERLRTELIKERIEL